MANKVFIRTGNPVPTARPAHPAIEFRNNVLVVDELDTEMVAALTAIGAEEVTAEDPRYDWIVTQGWSRQAQRDYARQPEPEVEG